MKTTTFSIHIKKTLTFLLILVPILSMNAQDPAIQWQHTIGGNDRDILYDINPTSDGGYILGGGSSSNISGDKTENSNGMNDIWVVKIDQTGTMEWQNTIGGSMSDVLLSIHQTSNGEYFVVSQSDSNISGDKTENSRGESDLWILKLNSTGEILWQRTYGGSGSEYNPSASLTSDGGLIITCTSASGISGDKTEPSKGIHDAWALKLDSNGNIEWQKSIGGSDYDYGKKIVPTIDGGYILAVSSRSNSSGDKTENSYLNTFDYWVVKLNADGIVQWDNTLGGNGADQLRNIIATEDGGYLLGGDSFSAISADKSENSIGGSIDYWIVKLDTNGLIVWDNTIGGNGTDYLEGGLHQISDGSYLISGSSDSDISGDKIEDSHGEEDVWLVKIDSSGVLVAQNTIGGAASDIAQSSTLNTNEEFVIGATSWSNISADKTENSQGWDDFWIVKMQSVSLGVESQTLLDTGIILHPNPVKDILIIENTHQLPLETAQIMDLTGKVMTTIDLKTMTLTKSISLEGYTSGVYLVKVSTGAESIIQRIVKY